MDFVVTGSTGASSPPTRHSWNSPQLPTEEQARGESLDRWLGRSGVDLDILIANLRQHGSVRLFASLCAANWASPPRWRFPPSTVMNGGQPCFGFAIRDVEPPAASGQSRARSGSLPRSLEHLTELIGRVRAEGSGTRSDRRDRAAVHRGGTRTHRRQPRLRRRDARSQPAEPLRQTAPLWPRGSRGGGRGLKE